MVINGKLYNNICIDRVWCTGVSMKTIIYNSLSYYWEMFEFVTSIFDLDSALALR